jgi:hypothetical protein
MSQTDLQEIKDYWRQKYPLVEILLWKHDQDSKYYGRMRYLEESTHFACETMGELIGQGEQFLRKVT